MNKRHIYLWGVLRPLVILFMKTKVKYTYEIAENLPETYLVLSNHTTDYDPLFVAASFKKQMYFVASEHIARWGWISKLIIYLVEPIMRQKGSSAAGTVMEVMRKIRKGHNVCIFAEGVRSWDGVTAEIPSSTAKMVKKANCGLVTYKIQGGYFASPMWAGAQVRKGPVHGAPVNVYTKEMLSDMSLDEIEEAIKRDLYEDAFERQEADGYMYKSDTPAEHMERLLFLCPECGSMESLSSSGEKVRCEKCGLEFSYNQYGKLEGLPFKNLRSVVDWQKERVSDDVKKNVCYRSSSGKLFTVKKHEEELVCEGEVSMDTESFKCGDFKADMNQITDLAMHGQRAVVFTANKVYYELIPEEGSNALKYYMYFNKIREQEKG